MAEKVDRFDHDPQGLLEDVATRWAGETLQVAVVIVLDAKGNLSYDGAAYKRREILWALEQFKHEVLFGKR